jgi:hypothetical protein
MKGNIMKIKSALPAFAALSILCAPAGAHPDGRPHGHVQGYVVFWSGPVTYKAPDAGALAATLPFFWKKAFVSIYKPASIDAASAASD